MQRRKLLLIAVVAVLIGAFFAFDLGHYFTLGYFKSQQAAIAAYYAAQPLRTAAIFFIVYVIVTALSLSLIHI